MAIGAGMTSAITNPLHAPEMMAVKGADVVMGHDTNCRHWIKLARGWEEVSVKAKAVEAPQAAEISAAVTSTISRRRLRKLRQAANA
jgi:5-methyltetrahydrofolate--homocysteine methyltransferase